MAEMRFWVLQVGVGPLPEGLNPADIPELAELEDRVRLVLPSIPSLFVSTFVADSDGERASLTDTLTFHQRREDGSCTCGWGGPGEPAASFAEHVARVFEESVRVRTTPDSVDVRSM